MTLPANELSFIWEALVANRKQSSHQVPDGWPFDQPPNCAVFTLRRIAEGFDPILFVSHDLDDHGWQFLGLDGGPFQEAAVIGLAHILELDPGIRCLADMPPGWCAWRQSWAGAWQTRRSDPVGDEDS